MSYERSSLNRAVGFWNHDDDDQSSSADETLTSCISDGTISTLDPEDKFLESHIDPEFGLLDKLLGNGALSSEQFYSIREKGTRLEKNKQLLEIPHPQLLETLNEDGQSHVTKFRHSKLILVFHMIDFIQTRAFT